MTVKKSHQHEKKTESEMMCLYNKKTHTQLNTHSSKKENSNIINETVKQLTRSLRI